MSSNSGVTAQRVMSSGDLRSRVESTVCDKCQDLCWSVEVWAYDLLGADAKACLLYRDHLGRQSEAAQALGRFWMSQSGHLLSAETAAWLVEHQQTLW